MIHVAKLLYIRIIFIKEYILKTTFRISLPDIRPLARPLAGLAPMLLVLGAQSVHATDLTAPIITVRTEHRAATLPDGRVLLVGGYPLGSSTPGGAIAQTEIYDPSTNGNAATGNLSIGRFNTALVTLADGRIMVIGGTGWINSQSVTLATAEIYDPASGAWSLPQQTLNYVRASAKAVTLPDGRVLIIGGDAHGNTAEVYDPSTGNFTLSGTLAAPRSNFSVAALPDGRVFVFGGVTPNTFNALTSIEVWSPATGAWTSGGALAVGRQNAAATLLANGKVLISGGYLNATAPNSAELYDPLTGASTPAGAMVTPRATHSATLLANGSVLVEGGYDASWATLKSIERYDPVANTWQTVGNTLNVHSDHTATLLPASQRVLIAGGLLDSRGSPNELYDPVCAAAPTAISPTAINVLGSGGSSSFTVTMPVGCPWALARMPTNMTIAGNSYGIGTGGPQILNYTVGPYTGTDVASGSTMQLNEATSYINQYKQATVFDASGASFPASGGTGHTTIVGPAGVPYPLNTLPAWIIANSGQGSGFGTFSYTVAANTTGPRSFSFNVGDGSYVISQADGACIGAKITPASANLPAAGGASTINVTANDACVWNLGNLPGWVTASAPSGTGTGSVTLTAATNSGASRNATIQVGTFASVALSQQADASSCGAPTLSTTSASFPSNGGSGFVGITADNGCPWSASSLPSWVTPIGSSSGQGNGGFTYSVAANTGAARSGAFNIGSQSVAVSEAAWVDPCTSTTLSPRMGIGINATGGSGSITISTAATCAWTVTNVPAWVNLSPISGKGSGTLNFYALPNGDKLPRNASITVGAQSTVISEDAYAECPSVSVDSNLVALPGKGGNSINNLVVTAGSCNWHISNLPSWITSQPSFANSTPPFGQGNLSFPLVGTLNDTGAVRSAVIQIDNQSITVVQPPSTDSCMPVLSPSTVSWPTNGGTVSIDVAVDPGCGWSALASSGFHSDWVTIVNGAKTTAGNGTLVLSTTANPGIARSGTVLVGNTSLTVNQDGAPVCSSVTLSSNGVLAATSGTTTWFTIASQPTGCVWTLSNVPDWVTVNRTTGLSGTDYPTITIPANTSTAIRGGFIHVADQIFRIDQEGTTAACTAIPIAPGSTTAGTLNFYSCRNGARGTSYYTNRYSFSGTAGQQVSLQITSASFDSYMYLENASGAVIASNDDSGGTTLSRIPANSGTYTLPATGTYTVEVSSYNQTVSGTGAYSLAFALK